VTLWPAMAGIDAAMAGYGRYRCSYGPKTKIADVVADQGAPPKAFECLADSTSKRHDHRVKLSVSGVPWQ